MFFTISIYQVIHIFSLFMAKFMVETVFLVTDARIVKSNYKTILGIRANFSHMVLKNLTDVYHFPPKFYHLNYGTESAQIIRTI